MFENFYVWVKALHIISVIAWMAAQLYLPRLFVYHAGVTVGSESDVLLQTMERRLLRYIMTPAMIAVYAFGATLAVYSNAFDPQNGIWMHVKFTLVLLLSANHGFMAATWRRFARGKNTRSPRFYKILNEVQTVLMMAVVIIVVVKPF